MNQKFCLLILALCVASCSSEEPLKVNENKGNNELVAGENPQLGQEAVDATNPVSVTLSRFFDRVTKYVSFFKNLFVNTYSRVKSYIEHVNQAIVAPGRRRR